MKQFFLITIVSMAVVQPVQADTFESYLFDFIDVRCDGVVIMDQTMTDPTHSGVTSYTIHGGLSIHELYEDGDAIGYWYEPGALEHQEVDPYITYLEPGDDMVQIRDNFLTGLGYARWNGSKENSICDAEDPDIDTDLLS